jgi:histidinol phosphatase-like PHP family hydrolase
MKYKIETHLHTTYISRCGWLGAEAIVKTYQKLGYDAICITDHYNRTAFTYSGIDLTTPGSKVHAFLEGYRRVKTYSEQEGGPVVIAGAEVRFDGSVNDYLCFGWPEELLADPEHVMSEGLEAFKEKCDRAGALLIQAHPFRKGCTPAPAKYLHGLEIYNPCPRHFSHNDRAYDYAKENNLIMTGGSDAHRPGEEGLSGITADLLPKDSFELADLIRSGKYEVIVHE